MVYNVVVFGSPDIVESIKDVGANFEEITLTEVVYHDPNQIVELFRTYHDKGDILLFGAHNAYFIIQEYLNRHQLNIDKPFFYVPYTAVSLYSSLFQVFKNKNLNPNKPIKFSIDYPAESELWICLEELKLNNDQAFSKGCNFDQNINELIEFHKGLWDTQQISIAITSFYLVHQRLIDEGIPTYRISPSKSSIRNTLEQLLLEIQKDDQTDHQFAICLFDMSAHHASYKQSSHKVKRNLSLYQQLFEYGEEMQALIDWSTINQVRIITTRGEIERNTKKLKNFMILEEIQNQFNKPTFLGIGFGRTANEADIRAKEALSKAKLMNTSNCAVIDTEGAVYGLTKEGRFLAYSARSESPERLLIAKESGLSVGTINKVISFIDGLGNPEFTASNLASGFGITLRSARRIINKLEQANYAKITGEEQPVGKGRPRYLYKLLL